MTRKRKYRRTGIKISQKDDYNEYHRRYYYLRVKPKRQKQRRRRKK